MILVGLTGTSGSGKGYVSRLFAERKIPSIDTDAVTHDLYSTNSECIAALAANFGDKILLPDGTIDRSKLADIVFSDREKLSLLNRIVHGFVLNETRSRIVGYAKTCDIVLIDAPQLFESGFDRECDCTIAVIADVDVRVARICERDNKTVEQAMARIRNQHDDAFFAKKCDYVIVNNGTDELESQIDDVILALKSKNEQRKV